ncbi:PrgI family protein [Candidatus Saccharibacteria bacterium]|nr:PrgI family protein [Candidatus Saccharibacteria bacterium]
MATYKVIQDVEAEDKILGPLTLKQLIFAIIVVGFGFGAFRVVTITGSIFSAIPFLPFMLFFGILAAPLGKNQPTEVWLAAQIHFFTKPKVRLWDQNDLKEVVHITVPKKEQKIYTDGLNQKQVKSRLSALASTLDSHGWAVKNIDLNTQTSGYNQPSTDDRLIGTPNIQQVPEEPVGADIFAPSTNEAREFDIMLNQSDVEHRQHIKQIMEQAKGQASNETAPSFATPSVPMATDPINSTTGQPANIDQTLQQPQQNIQAPNYSEANSQNTDQTSLEEQAIYKKILDQKHQQDQAPPPNYNHKTILPPGQTTVKNETQNTANNTQEPTTKDKPAIAMPKDAQTTPTNNDTITKDANANNLSQPAKINVSSPNKNQEDEVVIQLH